jgi:uncharacterized protein (DUF362 family)
MADATITGAHGLGAPGSSGEEREGAATGVTPSVDELERALLDDVQSLLLRWSSTYAGRPKAERQRLLLLALEREQIVAVAYREEAVAGRVSALAVEPEIRALIRQTLVWIWKDEQLHAEYIRGELLRAGGLRSDAVVYGRQLQGALSGWTSATSNHRDAHTAPFRAGAASVLVAVAGLTHQIPPLLQHELRYQTFHRYCELNVALEASAELAYRRLIEVTPAQTERRTIDRIRQDEACHAAAFRVLAAALTSEDLLAQGCSTTSLIRDLGSISPWFVPASLRSSDGSISERGPSGPRRGGADRRTFGSRCTVVARQASDDHAKLGTLYDCLDSGGLAGLASGARTAAVRVSFMLGYHREDRSNVNDPELVDGLARYLHDHGVRDVAVLEAPTVYGNDYAHRSVPEVARYFGFDSSAYRVVDIGADLRPFTYQRGFVQHAISATWMDADLRIIMPKLRTDPTEFAHLGLSTLEGSTGAIDATFYAGRQVDFRSATMMLLDVAPPDFEVVDGWAPVAQGPFGVMGCDQPADVRCLYAGADALSVDEAVLHDLGIEDPREAPIVRLVYHWFGLPTAPVSRDGARPALGRELRGAHASRLLRALGAAGYPIYVYLSGGGQLFVPAIDTQAFPPLHPVAGPARVVQWVTQRAFGLRPPAIGSRELSNR